MTLQVELTATTDCECPVTANVAIYRRDGVKVTQLRSDNPVLSLERGGKVLARLDFGPLNLGNAHYVVSVGIYRVLDPMLQEESQRYDLLDRSYEFRVDGHPPIFSSVFQHRGTWTFEKSKLLKKAA